MGFFLFGEGTMNGMGENMAAKMEMHISVRGLVEFILRTGNIDNRKAVSPENAMQEGGRIHRMIQRRMGADYHAEVLGMARNKRKPPCFPGAADLALSLRQGIKQRTILQQGVQGRTMH